MQYNDVTTIPRWRTAAILKIVLWLYLESRRYINAKFGGRKQNHVQTQVT